MLGGERAMGRRAPTPGVGGVHVVVMDQCARVQHLPGGTGPEQGVLVIHLGTHRQVAPPAERGPEALAPGDAASCLLEEGLGKVRIEATPRQLAMAER